MELPRTRAIAPEVTWLDSCESTNTELRERIRAGERPPHGTTLVTANQTSGRGRLDRGWVTPPHQAVAVSVLIHHEFLGGSGLDPTWLPLIAGSAVVAALQPLYSEGSGMRVGVKWPNDVHVRSEADAETGDIGLKLCGILSELLPGGDVVVGMGINLLIDDYELPTERATSLTASGANVGDAWTVDPALDDGSGAELVDRVLATAVSGLLELVSLAQSQPERVRTRVLRHSLTLGTTVRVHLPDGTVVDGRAAELAEDGSLLVDLPTGGQLSVSAGDVEHLR